MAYSGLNQGCSRLSKKAMFWESRGNICPLGKASLVPTTAVLNGIKGVQRDHSQLKRVARDPVGPPLARSHPLTSVDFSNPCTKLLFHSFAQQTVASLYVSSSPYRKVGQKHASYRDSV